MRDHKKEIVKKIKQFYKNNNKAVFIFPRGSSKSITRQLYSQICDRALIPIKKQKVVYMDIIN